MHKEIKTPLAIVAAATDLLMVSDSHSHSVYQVSINNNGAFLQGTVSLLMTLRDMAHPFGLTFDGNSMYVANLSSNGGITKFNLATSETLMIVRNMPSCHTVHRVDVSTDGTVLLTDRGSHVVRSLLPRTSDIPVVAGSGVGRSRDGSSLARSFSQPTALCVEGKTTHVADTAVGAIRLITPTNSLNSYEDCLLFTLSGCERIHRDAVTGKVEEGHFERGGNYIKLTEMSYETYLRFQNDVEVLLPEKGSCKVASDPDSED